MAFDRRKTVFFGPPAVAVRNNYNMFWNVNFRFSHRKIYPKEYQKYWSDSIFAAPYEIYYFFQDTFVVQISRDVFNLPFCFPAESLFLFLAPKQHTALFDNSPNLFQIGYSCILLAPKFIQNLTIF